MSLLLSDVINFVVAVLFAGLVAFLLTPPVRVLAYKLKAIDIPRDERRMHKKITPRLGGLAIFLAFALSVLLFCEVDEKILGLLLGAIVIVIVGVLDDIYRIPAILKLIGQIVASVIPVLFGISINFINLFGHYVDLGIFSAPVTVIWIVCVTNAINLVDGLDGLACGISTISAVSIMVFALLEVNLEIALIVAILVGSCIGFMPYNRFPASIFMGDTGALFLGYTLSLISILGVFKLNAFVSFWTPFLIFALPLADTFTSALRRIIHGISPFQADRGHFHHKLIDLGLNQKQVVRVLYALSAIFGISAIMFTEEKILSAILIIVITFVIGFFNYRILASSQKIREQMGLHLKEIKPAEDTSKESEE